MKFALILTSLTTFAATSPLREYLETWRSPRNEAELCALAENALHEYDVLVEDGVPEERITPGRPVGAVRAQLLETLAGCLGFD